MKKHPILYDSALLSVKEENIFNFSMHPNPSKNQVTIDLPSELIIEKIDVFNNLGLLVVTSQEEEMNISFLSSGVYFVRVTTNKGRAIEKLIVE